MAPHSNENDLLEFCMSRSEYEECVAFFQENNFTSINYFLEHFKEVSFEFCTKFPRLSVGTFIEEAKEYQKYLAEQQNQALLVVVEGECYHKCCLELKDKVARLEAEVEKLRELLTQELSKFAVDPSGCGKVELVEGESGDLVLENQWRVRCAWLKEAANHPETTKGLKGLTDRVFGKRLLKCYQSFSMFPDSLKRASDSLISQYVDARIEAKGGSYKEIHQIARQHFTKRIRNFNDYAKNKKRKLEGGDQTSLKNEA